MSDPFELSYEEKQLILKFRTERNRYKLNNGNPYDEIYFTIKNDVIEVRQTSDGHPYNTGKVLFSINKKDSYELIKLFSKLNE